MTETEHRHFNASGFYLYDHMDEAPVPIIVCGQKPLARPQFTNVSMSVVEHVRG